MAPRRRRTVKTMNATTTWKNGRFLMCVGVALVALAAGGGCAVVFHGNGCVTFCPVAESVSDEDVALYPESADAVIEEAESDDDVALYPEDSGEVIEEAE